MQQSYRTELTAPAAHVPPAMHHPERTTSGLDQFAATYTAARSRRPASNRSPQHPPLTAAFQTQRRGSAPALAVPARRGSAAQMQLGQDAAKATRRAAPGTPVRDRQMNFGSGRMRSGPHTSNDQLGDILEGKQHSGQSGAGRRRATVRDPRESPLKAACAGRRALLR